MKTSRKRKHTPGDILQMMVDTQLRAGNDELEEMEKPQEHKALPIISINGIDVSWHELEFEGRKKKDKAA